MAFTKTTENDRPYTAAPDGAPAPGVRVPDTGRRNLGPSGAGPCRRKGGRAGLADGILQTQEELTMREV